MVTILEALQNAEYNLSKSLGFTKTIGLEQLNNAIILLEKGYDIYDKVEPLLEKYGDVEDIPEKE